MNIPKPKKRGRPATGKTPIRSIRVPDAEWDAWRRAAEKNGLDISGWAREILNRAAARAFWASRAE